MILEDAEPKRDVIENDTDEYFVLVARMSAQPVALISQIPKSTPWIVVCVKIAEELRMNGIITGIERARRDA